jgi:hypothetical protein
MLVSRHERIPTMSISTLYEVSQRWDLVEALPSKNSNLDKDRRQEVLPAHKRPGFRPIKACPNVFLRITNNTKSVQDIHDD